MQIDEVHILVNGNHNGATRFNNSSHFTAWEGFRDRGFWIEFSTQEQIDDLIANKTENILIVGGVQNCLNYFKAFNKSPSLEDYPSELWHFLDRKIAKSTLGEIRKKFSNLKEGEINEPIFMKSVGQKRFTGYVVSGYKDLLRSIRLPNDEEIYISPVLNFESEWRCYIHKKEIIKISNYRGNPTTVPSVYEMNIAIKRFTEAPIAYCLDFGVIDCGATVLVEANDMYALGNYGIFSMQYSKMMEDRWLEIMQTPSP